MTNATLINTWFALLYNMELQSSIVLVSFPPHKLFSVCAGCQLVTDS